MIPVCTGCTSRGVIKGFKKRKEKKREESELFTNLVA